MAVKGCKEDVWLLQRGVRFRFTTQPRLIQLFDKETQNNLIWFDEASAKANAPVCKEYNF